MSGSELIRDIVIKAESGKPIYLRDVAQVIYGYKQRSTMSRENGQGSCSIVIKKEAVKTLSGLQMTSKLL
ncbi:MAG: efflux RND transporter permease subunit [Ignavibacteria bacterium]|nr:efflux RND transporter permease subunit [Ignavibacteria bacterium]